MTENERKIKDTEDLLEWLRQKRRDLEYSDAYVFTNGTVDDVERQIRYQEDKLKELRCL